MAPLRCFSSLVFLMVIGLTASTIQAMEDVSRIIGGTITTIEKFPWQVALIVTMNNETKLCGGSIISKSWILSAAHCFSEELHEGFKRKATRIVVYAGITKAPSDTSDPESIIDENDIKNDHVIIHPNYNSGADFNNDIALIKLKKPLTLNEKVQIIALANEHDNKPGKELIASGWGHINDDGPFAPTLQYIDGLELKSWEWCCNYWKNLTIVFTEKMICHFTKSRNVCQGDSGGAVVTSIGNSNGPPYVQIGIVSFGYRGACARNPMDQSPGLEDILPSIFTDVTKFGKWINETISNFQF